MSSSAIFSGASRYASDLAEVMDRSIKIASLPLTQLQSEKTDLEDRSQALSELRTKFDAVQSAIESIGNAAANTTYTASISSGTVLKANLTGEVLTGKYSVEVVDYGSETAMLSAASLPQVADPLTDSISSSTSYTLTIDGVDTTIEPEGTSLLDLANAINAAGVGATATIINVGPPAAPDYRLSIRADNPGATAITLNDGTQDLVETVSTGAPVQYRINGGPDTPLEANTRSIEVAPGLTVEVLGEGSSDVTIGRTTADIRSAISSFVTAYNSTLQALGAHRGEGKGALNGDSVVYTLQQSLRGLLSFTGSSATFSSPSDIGLSVTETGTLTFDQSAISNLPPDQMAEFLGFIGGASTSGFLKSAAGQLDGINNSSDGVFQLTLDSLDRQIERQDDLIAANEDRIQLYIENLQSRMAAADTLIASLEQQVVYFDGLFQAMAQANKTFSS